MRESPRRKIWEERGERSERESQARGRTPPNEEMRSQASAGVKIWGGGQSGTAR